MKKQYKHPKLLEILGVKEPIKYTQVLYKSENTLHATYKGKSKPSNVRVTEKSNFKYVNKPVNDTVDEPENDTVEEPENETGDGSVFLPVGAETFVDNVLLKYIDRIRFYPKTSEYFLYSPHTGLYRMYSHQEFTSLMTNLIMESPLRGYVDAVKYADKVTQALKGTDAAYYGFPELDHDYLVMKNGCLNLKTKEFKGFSQNIFQTTSVQYLYDPSATCPMFLSFLNGITGGKADRVRLLRCWMHTVLTYSKKAQIFLYLYGPAGSGKTMFSNFLAALIGRERVIYTTLKNLNTDRFEIYNLRFKSLINISDAERFEADVPILKQIVGSDPLNANIKYIQGSVEIKKVGNVMIVSNHPFKSRDNSSALLRRLVPFQTTFDHSLNKSRTPLVEPHEEGFQGPGISELPGILNWVLGTTHDECEKCLTDVLKEVPSLTELIQHARTSINPLCTWVSENLNPSPSGSLVFGLKGAAPDTLYGSYTEFCTSEGIAVLQPRRFREDLVNHLQSIPMFSRCYTKKTRLGQVLFNVTWAQPPEDFVDDNVKIWQSDETSNTLVSKNVTLWQSDKTFNNLVNKNVTLWQSDETFNNLVNKNTKTNPLANEQVTTDANFKETFDDKTSVRVKLINAYKYYISLKNHPDSSHLIKIGMFNLPDILVEAALHHQLENVKKTTMDGKFFNIRKLKMEKSNKNMERYGILVQEYTNMGASPRLQPLVPTPGNSVTAYSNTFRTMAYLCLKDKLDDFYQSPGVLIDLDISSCYMNILLGLYPTESHKLGSLLDKGVWNSLERYFQNKGCGNIYKKSWAKACVYSSFFSGGASAMIESIMKKEQERLGLVPSVFEKHESYAEIKAAAGTLVNLISQSDIILEIRNTAALVEKRGLTLAKTKFPGFSNLCVLELFDGAVHKFNLKDFRNGFSYTLMDYEINIMAKTFLEFREFCKHTIVLGHFHDGATIYIPNKDLGLFAQMGGGCDDSTLSLDINTKILNKFNSILVDVSRDFKLKKPLVMEIKNIPDNLLQSYDKCKRAI